MNLIEATIQALTGNKIEEKANVANAEINKKLLNPNANKSELQRNGYNVSREGGFTSVKRADRVNDFRELAVFDDGEVLPVTDKNIGDKTINKDAFDAKNFLDTNRKEELPVMSKVDKFKMNKDTIAQADMEIADAEIEKKANPEDAKILDTNVIKPWKKMKSKAQSENDRLLKREVTESYFEDELDFGENDKDIPEVEKQYKLKIKDITEPNAKHNSVYRLTGNKEDIVKFINDNYDEEDRAEVLKYVKECTKINESIEGTAHIMNKINNAMKEIASGNVTTNIYELTSEIEEEIARAEAEEDKSAVEVLTAKLHEINNAYSKIADKDDKEDIREDKELLVEDLDEAFYEKICRAYIDTVNLEWVTTNPENYDSIVHGYFADDSEAEKWGYGEGVSSDNFKEVAYDGYSDEEIENGDAEWYEYETWEDFYNDFVKENIEYDINDIGVYSDGTTDYDEGINHWDFYISEEDLKKLDLIEDEDDAKTENKKLNEDVKITNAFDKAIDIENSDGDTLMSFKISSDGAIYGFENCEVADEEADSIRIQQVGSLGEYADLAENKSIKLEDISMNGILDYREIIDKDNGDLVDTFFFDHKLTADEDAKIKEAIENAKLEDDYDNYTVMEYVNKIVPIKQTLSAIYSDLGASTGKQLYY